MSAKYSARRLHYYLGQNEPFFADRMANFSHSTEIYLMDNKIITADQALMYIHDPHKVDKEIFQTFKFWNMEFSPPPGAGSEIVSVCH
jgi:hypothetical protein